MDSYVTVSGAYVQQNNVLSVNKEEKISVYAPEFGMTLTGEAAKTYLAKGGKGTSNKTEQGSVDAVLFGKRVTLKDNDAKTYFKITDYAQKTKAKESGEGYISELDKKLMEFTEENRTERLFDDIWWNTDEGKRVNELAWSVLKKDGQGSAFIQRNRNNYRIWYGCNCFRRVSSCGRSSFWIRWSWRRCRKYFENI